jgi:hypothetical protein
VNKRKMTTLVTAGLAGLAVPFALGATAVGQQQTVTTCPAGVTAPSPYCTVTTTTTPPPAGTTTGTTTTQPGVTQTAPSQSAGPNGPKLKTNLTVKRKPARDRKAPFKYTISGSVNGGPKTTSCAGKLAFVVKRGKTAVQTKTITVPKNCKYSVTLRYSAKKLKVKKGTLSLSVEWKGNDRLAASKHSTKLRFG